MLKVQRVSDSASLLSLTSKPQLISVRESVAKTPKKLSASPSKKNVRTDASVLKEVQNTPKRSKSAVRVDIKRTTPSPKRNISPSRNTTTTIRVEGQAKLPSQTIRPKKQYEKQKEEQERLREEIFAVNRLMKMLDDKKWKMAEMASANLERMTLTV
jgi:hypothetical protein